MAEVTGFQRGRRPKNATEAEFYDLAVNNGWTPVSRGWPDFILEREGKVICVEVVPAANRGIREPKRAVLSALQAAGIDCYVWSPDGGFVRASAGGKGVVVETETSGEQGELLERGSGGKQERTNADVQTSEVDEVWEHFVAVMKPRRKEAGEEERIIIRAALRVATVDECKRAISVCAASDYHMKRGEHAHRKGQRYNKLSQILKGRPRRGQTTRERIDWWLDREGEQGFPSADAAMIAQKQLEVQRGHRFPHDEEMVGKAEKAEAWLAKHGIETVRDSSGAPRFQPRGERG